jgi:hypothetical protein
LPFLFRVMDFGAAAMALLLKNLSRKRPLIPAPDAFRKSLRLSSIDISFHL